MCSQCNLGGGSNSNPQKGMFLMAHCSQENSGLPPFEIGPFVTLVFIHAEHYSSHLLVWMLLCVKYVIPCNTEVCVHF